MAIWLIISESSLVAKNTSSFTNESEAVAQSLPGMLDSQAEFFKYLLLLLKLDSKLIDGLQVLFLTVVHWVCIT